MTQPPHPHLADQRERAGRRWLELTRDDHILIAPIISFAAFACIAIGNRSIFTAVLALILQSVLFQIAVVAHLRQPRLRRAAYIAAPLLVVGIVALAGALAAFVGIDSGRFIATAFSAALTFGVIIRIFGRVAKAPVIDLRAVVNAITVYLMLGLFFAYVFMSIGAISHDAFFVQGPDQPTVIYLYFSYITLATIGYGDFTPAHTAGRLLAVSEGLMGQLYLVTVLALIVSNLGRQRGDGLRRRGSQGDPRADDADA
ncbi:MAG: potassium channel family protein [Gaiellales bacterium]